MLADGVAVGRDHEGRRRTGGNALHMDAPPLVTTKTAADARLRANARGRDGGVRQKLAARVAPMTSHHEEPTPLPALVWAVVFTILLVAAVAIFVLVVLR